MWRIGFVFVGVWQFSYHFVGFVQIATDDFDFDHVVINALELRDLAEFNMERFDFGDCFFDGFWGAGMEPVEYGDVGVGFSSLCVVVVYEFAVRDVVA